jgi:hypothetical protein
MLSCKIFKHFALQVGSSNWVHKLRSTPFKDVMPKLANPLSFWRSSSTPSKYFIRYSWSRLTNILYYIKMSVRWNTLLRNQISSCQQVFYYNVNTTYQASWRWCSPLTRREPTSRPASGEGSSMGWSKQINTVIRVNVVDKYRYFNSSKSRVKIPGLITVKLLCNFVRAK